MSYQTKYANKKKDDSRSVISQQSKKSAQSEQTKTDMIVKMQQNEEKHKQLMQENAKRRREQEKKLKQQEEEKLRKQSEALNERKKTKEQAYIHYLRNNSKNILNEFKNQNVPKQEKKPAVSNQTNQNLNFEALDLETSQLHKNKNLHKNFQNHWEDIDVLRKSELLDSLDLSTCKSKRAKDNKQPGLILTDLKEENSESEDELWKQTFKNGKIQKQADKKVDQRTPIWTDQLAHQADDVISKISHKSKSPLPIPPQPQKVEKHSQSQQRQQIVTNIQPTQQIKQQQPKFEQPKGEQVQPERKPPSNIKITTNIQPKPQRQQQQVVQNNNQKSLISEDGNYIKEFLKVKTYDLFKEDLMNINNVELQLQKELQLLNKENKQKIEQVNQKYGVRDLHTSSQVNRNVFVPQQGPIKSVEDQIEASLLKLDIMLQQPNQGSTQVVVNNIRPQVQQQFQQPQQQQIQQQYQPAQQQNTQQYQNVQQTQQISQDYERQLLEQQVYLQQQLLFAQQQLQQHKLQSQQQSQNQSMQSNKMDLPQFPKFQTHQDHNEFMEASQQTNKPRNVSDQNSSIVPSQASQDKYNFDVDFKQPNSYQKQQQKKVQQKQSLVKPIQENIEEESQDGKIEVRQDLRNLLFD
ncbi:hypothetical protein pb186bvf_001839 [Paramecium bursaria]